MTSSPLRLGIGRRRALGILVGFGLAPLLPRRAWAEEPEVPIETQVKLLGKVVHYDRNAALRMAGIARLLILRRAGDASSARVAAMLRTDLAALGAIAGASVDVRERDFVDAATVRSHCTEQAISLLVVTPALSTEIPAIAEALDGTDLISVATLARDVERGAVLGFSLESSRPTITINLGRAKRQNVDFSSRLLALAKVVGE